MRRAIRLALFTIPLAGCLPPLPDKGDSVGDELEEGTADGEDADGGPADPPVEGDEGSLPMDDGDIPVDDGAWDSDDGSSAPPDLGDGSDDGFDSTGIEPFCGDGMIDGMEVCDGGDLDGQTCQSLGLGGGVLACRPACDLFDTSGCGPVSTNCCEARTEPGCELPEVQSCVCASDSYCCSTAWDSTCAAASTSCGAVCG